MEPVGLNKASAEVADEMLRQRVVVQVVARVQMANTDARFSESDGFPGSSKLGEFSPRCQASSSGPTALPWPPS